ncbi:MAG: RNA polymerase sigma factor [candidate division WOR-3 bacterium]|nr:MAG: RNA polymerase sigma factor [candidate division WOR-3 bacterium]
MKRNPSLLLKKEIGDDEVAKIIEGAKHDDAEALERLAEYVYPRIFSYIYYRVHHTEDAEDLTSEVIVKMIKALKKQHGHFHAWMYKIASNALIDFYRKRAVRSEISLSEMTRAIPDTSVNFSKQILLRKNLKPALAALTEEQRQVIILKFIQEHENEEIAKIMGKSIGAVKLLQFRALKSLRKYFERKGYETKD